MKRYKTIVKILVLLLRQFALLLMTFKSCQKSLYINIIRSMMEKNDLNVSNDEYETIESKLEIRQIIALVSTILL